MRPLCGNCVHIVESWDSLPWDHCVAIVCILLRVENVHTYIRNGYKENVHMVAMSAEFKTGGRSRSILFSWRAKFKGRYLMYLSMNLRWNSERIVSLIKCCSYGIEIKETLIKVGSCIFPGLIPTLQPGMGLPYSLVSFSRYSLAWDYHRLGNLCL